MMCVDCTNYLRCRELGAIVKDNLFVENTCSEFHPNTVKESSAPTILDSGDRKKFDSGAVRDISEGKGRFDLIPISIVATLFDDVKISRILSMLHEFMVNKDYHALVIVINTFCEYHNWTIPEMLLEVAKHYEARCVKYGERNWEKGIPLHSYIDSGLRHLMKFLLNYNDEPHDRAFIWNMLGAMWTVTYRSDLDDVELGDNV